MTGVLLWITVVLVGVVALLVAVRLRSRATASPDLRAASRALELVGSAVPPLRHGLDRESAAVALPPLRRLLATDGVALLGPDGEVLGADGPAGRHAAEITGAATEAAASGRRSVVRLALCGSTDCTAARALLQPLVVAGRPAGVLAVLAGSSVGPHLVTATDECARFVSGQLELAGADSARADLARAEARALRAQISPHFVYNSLATIAAFVRSDPDRARDLLLDFADYTRYSFRSAGDFTTLADELGNIDRYLALERARFGDRLQVRLRISPEVLGVVMPFLAVQPLVENAVRHGLADRPDGGTVTIEAADVGADCVISVEDDGIGMDPATVGVHDAGETHVGLGNVDDRLRAVFGEDYGLVVETAPGAGTKVVLRVPKFAPGVRVD
ncbi:sensor histidine kinase [Nakamurella sp. YIM 132087]|uniref:Sensor histidine kinase n=1 Tax=Nakamurella alba TaxID=2665158 RepID=A0A7K1FGU4_9ACTN|nr:histidine kinase [Nakamurella alba]MTD12689.1 sensor histidine kinase [Nakamurella alba]